MGVLFSTLVLPVNQLRKYLQLISLKLDRVSIFIDSFFVFFSCYLYLFNTFPFTEKEYELNIVYEDYNQILFGGNFINFVCMIYDEANKKSAISHENFRLKVLLVWQQIC